MFLWMHAEARARQTSLPAIKHLCNLISYSQIRSHQQDLLSELSFSFQIFKQPFVPTERLWWSPNDQSIKLGWHRDAHISPKEIERREYTPIPFIFLLSYKGRRKPNSCFGFTINRKHFPNEKEKKTVWTPNKTMCVQIWRGCKKRERLAGAVQTSCSFTRSDHFWAGNVNGPSHQFIYIYINFI